VPHDDGWSVLKRPVLWNLEYDEIRDWNWEKSHEDKQYIPPDLCPSLLTQTKLNVIIIYTRLEADCKMVLKER
jgi:hypothetical protein